MRAGLRTLPRGISLKGKPVTLAWQAQSGGSVGAHQLYRTPAELKTLAERERIRALNEDFRRGLFGLEAPRPVEVEIPDPVFGLERPRAKPLDTALISELFRHPPTPAQLHLARLRQDYLPALCEPFSVQDSALVAALELLQGEDGGETGRVAALIRQTGFMNLPHVALHLTFVLDHRSTEVENALEDAISAHLHVFSLTELCLIRTALCNRAPKRCSMDLRRRLRQKTLNELRLRENSLPLADFLLLWNSFRAELNSPSVARLLFGFLRRQQRRLSEALKRDPHLGPDLWYAYANCRMNARFRKVAAESDELRREEEFVEELVGNAVLVSLAAKGPYPPARLLRLLTAVNLCKVTNHEELFDSVEEVFTVNFDALKCDFLLFADTVKFLASANGQSGIGSRACWASLAETAWKGVDLATADVSSLVKLLTALVRMKAINVADFDSVMNALLARPDELTFDTLAELSFAFVCFRAGEGRAITTERFEALCLLLFQLLSRGQEWISVSAWQKVRFFARMCAVLHPEWDQTYIELLGYHADKRVSTSRLRPKALTADLTAVATVLQADLKFSLISLCDFNNLFLVDFASEDHKFAVWLRSSANMLSSATGETATTSAVWDAQHFLLELDGWTVCDISLEEFNELGPKRAAWLQQHVGAAFALAVENARAHLRDRKTEPVKRLVRMIGLGYEDPKHQPSAVMKERMRGLLAESRIELDAEHPDK